MALEDSHNPGSFREYTWGPRSLIAFKNSAEKKIREAPEGYAAHHF